MFSIATVNLLNPIRPIKQGTFNTRDIDPKALDQLIESMELVGVLSNLYSNAIPILADPAYIHPSSIFTDITRISEAPELKLTREGEKEVKKFYAAGGNHRTTALQKVKERLQGKIEGLKSQIEDNKDKKDNKTKVKLVSLRDDLKICEKKMDGLGKWTVILYNYSK
jgi:hypothetical protein